MATPPIVSEVVEKHEYLLLTERSPALPVLDSYRYPLPQFVGLIDVKWGKDSLECQVVETIERIWPKASCDIRLLGSCWSWRVVTSATIVVSADQTFGHAGMKPSLTGKERIWKGRSELRRNHLRDLKGSAWGFC
jgi:hypothetical protein